jgi:hypothetical protein
VTADHIEDAVNIFGRRFLGASNSVAWTSKSVDRDPATIPGAEAVILRECRGRRGRVRSAGNTFDQTIWLFDPRARYDQLLDEISDREPTTFDLPRMLTEIAVLIPMIDGLDIRNAVEQINGVLPAKLRCSIPKGD